MRIPAPITVLRCDARPFRIRVIFHLNTAVVLAIVPKRKWLRTRTNNIDGWTEHTHTAYIQLQFSWNTTIQQTLYIWLYVIVYGCKADCHWCLIEIEYGSTWFLSHSVVHEFAHTSKSVRKVPFIFFFGVIFEQCAVHRAHERSQTEIERNG